MTKTTHDTYPFPTIAEALCETHFRLPDGKSWDDSWPQKIYEQLKSEYPQKEQRELREVRAEIGPAGFSVVPGDPTPRLLLKHKERPNLIQLSPGLFTVNELPKYMGWQQFISDYEFGWDKLNALIQPSSISRIGLRYINRIQKKHADEPLSDWLAESDYYPKQILQAKSRFMSRFEHNLSPGIRLIVTLAESAAAENEAPSIIFDIDAISEGELPTSWKNLRKQMTDLHDRIWVVFDTAKTPRLEKLLRKGSA